MATTFGTRPEDTVADSRGNVQPGVVIQLYPTKTDAQAQTALIASATTDSQGLWSYSDASSRTGLWARDPSGRIWAVNPEEFGPTVDGKADKTYVDSQDALRAPIANPTFTGTVSGITKTMVGLGSVDNTADANKPVSTAQQTALNGKVSHGELVVNVKDYGAVADWNGTTGTDNTTAFTNALAATPSGGRLYVPAGRYYFASNFPAITQPIEFFGGASGLSVGTVGTQLVFAAGKSGPSIPQTASAAGWHWHDIECSSLSTAAGSDVGWFFGGGYGTAERLTANGFGSHGFHFKAGSTVGNGNVNNAIGARLRAYSNRGDGVRCEGSDANAILLVKPDVVANYGWGVNLEGTSRVVVQAPHADQQYNSAPGAFRDNGNSNVWDHVYSEGGIGLTLDTGSSYTTILLGQYGAPTITDLTAGKSALVLDPVNGFRSFLISGPGATPTKFSLGVDGYAASALAITHVSGPGGGAKNVAVYQRNTDTWQMFAKVQPNADLTLDLGTSGARWRDVYASQLVRPSVTKTANYTLTSADNIVIFNGTSLTATLPDPTTAGLPGRVFVVKNAAATSLTVNSAGTSKTLDGAASQTLAQWAKATYTSDGTQWLTV